MTKEEIIEMANKAKLPHDYVGGELMWLDKLEQFAKLVAEKEYERGFIDGMQKQMQSSVDKAVNAMGKREWVGLTVDEIAELVCNLEDPENRIELGKKIEAKLKEKNGY
jgi:predicted ATPase